MDINFFWETDYQRVNRLHNDRKKLTYLAILSCAFILLIVIIN